MRLKTNAVYCGDCKNVLVQFPKESVDLIYVDPPFFSNKKYKVLWGDGHELRAFEDRWEGGIENYITWMEDKLRECYRVLKKTGSMYLHCNYYANAHLRILMDEIFEPNNFRNEIIWYYRGEVSPKIVLLVGMIQFSFTLRVIIGFLMWMRLDKNIQMIHLKD
jgi:DNA modification methylase